MVAVAILLTAFVLFGAPAPASAQELIGRQKTADDSIAMSARVTTADGVAIQMLTRVQTEAVFGKFGRQVPTTVEELRWLNTAEAATMPIAVAVPFGGSGREVYMYTPPATAGWASLFAEDANGRLTLVSAYGLGVSPLAGNRLSTQQAQRPVAWLLNFQDQQGRSVNARYATATTSLPVAADRVFLDPLGNGDFLLVVVATDKFGVAQCYARPIR